MMAELCGFLVLHVMMRRLGRSFRRSASYHRSGEDGFFLEFFCWGACGALDEEEYEEVHTELLGKGIMLNTCYLHDWKQDSVF